MKSVRQQVLGERLIITKADAILVQALAFDPRIPADQREPTLVTPVARIILDDVRKRMRERLRRHNAYELRKVRECCKQFCRENPPQ